MGADSINPEAIKHNRPKATRFIPMFGAGTVSLGDAVAVRQPGSGAYPSSRADVAEGLEREPLIGQTTEARGMNRLKFALNTWLRFRDLRAGRASRGERVTPVLFDDEFRSVPRYGYGKLAHAQLSELLDRGHDSYVSMLERFLEFKEDLSTIPLNPPADHAMPYWRNGYFEALDPVSLYSLACLNNPQTYVEIGSGNSTKFMRKAIDDHALRTRIVSIDPEPRAEVDRLCDEILRQRLETIDLGIFQSLRANDVLFIDGSHRVFMNSDVAVVFLDILPQLEDGVLIYIDDIFLPLDYPPEWTSRYYSEQYLLAVLLLADEGRRYDVVLPCFLVEQHPRFQPLLDRLWNRDAAGGCGNGFWLRVRQSPPPS